MVQRIHLPTSLEEAPSAMDQVTYHTFPGTIYILSAQSIPAHIINASCNLD
jgi:hypothetical protein